MEEIIESHFKNVFKEIDATNVLYRNYTLFEKLFFLKDAEISSRKYFSWKDVGLTPTESNEEEDSDSGRKWVKLNFTHFIWLKTIEAFRNFGVNIRSCCDEL